jgi:hypothetical protein
MNRGRDRDGVSGVDRRILHEQKEPAMPSLSISSEKVVFLIEKAREFDVKEATSDPESGSNATDDDMRDVLEDDGDDPVSQEITGFIAALTDDEKLDLLALVQLGRGDGTLEEWDEMRAEAAREELPRTAHNLLGEPMLGDLLAEGLSEFGISFADVERITPAT